MKNGRRDITIAKDLAEMLRTHYDPSEDNLNFGELVDILTKLDARRSKREKRYRATKKASSRRSRGSSGAKR